IPFQLKRPLNLLNQPLIRQIRDLMEYIQDEFTNPFSGEHRLFRLLHAPWWNLEPVQLARVAASRQTRRDETDQEGNYLKMTRVEREQNAKSLRETLLDAEWLGSIPGIDAKAFQRAGAALESLISALYESPAPVLMEQLFNRSGALAWALNQPDKSAYIQMLYSFQEFVQQEALRQPRLSLAQCLSLLRSMDDNDISLPLLPGPEAQNGVQLMTAHASKGLEFDLVFMLDSTEDAWDKKNSGKNRQFSLPPTLTLSGEEDETEARRRLFYVAMTRAKQRLHISYAHLKEDNKPLKVSRFIAETGLIAQEASVQSTALTTAQARLLLTAESPNITLPDQQLMDALLTDFRLSISAFNRYLRCPLAFFYDDILKVSGATSESAAFGLAMHGALQQLVLKMKSDKQMAWPTAESLVRWFNKEMERQSSFFHEKNFDQRLKMGREYLRRLHVEQVPYWKKRAIVERRIDRVEWNGVPMTGVLDKIEWYDNGTLRIVDYKTGKPDKNKTAAPNEKQPLGGEYWRQLAFYHILLTQSRLYAEPVGKTAISWLEPDPKGTFLVVEITFSAEELQLVQGWITSVYNNIQARNFNTGCEDPACVWCQMHRDRHADVWIADHAEDGLDDSP
ncbi:MAG: ATP-dependent helicase, partial [Saprospiraceae bacterium]|nr:ATP-dependent helicase [Saprospiraceae bacterium]